MSRQVGFWIFTGNRDGRWQQLDDAVNRIRVASDNDYIVRTTGLSKQKQKGGTNNTTKAKKKTKHTHHCRRMTSKVCTRLTYRFQKQRLENCERFVSLIDSWCTFQASIYQQLTVHVDRNAVSFVSSSCVWADGGSCWSQLVSFTSTLERFGPVSSNPADSSIQINPKPSRTTAAKLTCGVIMPT